MTVAFTHRCLPAKLRPVTGSPLKSEIGLLAALSIGVRGMIGAGIFSILGVVARISGSERSP